MVAKAASKLPEPGRSTGLESEIDAKSMQFQRHKLGAETHAVEQKPIRNPQKPEDSGEKSRKKSRTFAARSRRREGHSHERADRAQRVMAHCDVAARRRAAE